MARLLGLLLVVAITWFGLKKHEERNRQIPAASVSQPMQRTPAATFPPPAAPMPASAVTFKCDGRIHCSQMTSCAEANFFLKNCPGTKMDGDGDGIPCESQWCSK
jgi:hypothetical protein